MRIKKVGKSDSRDRAQIHGSPHAVPPERLGVRIDGKGRLSITTADLVASKTFRTQLNQMVELASNSHTPKQPSAS